MSMRVPDDVSEFIYHECELLDCGDHESWLQLFTDDARYWVPLAPGQADAQSDHSLIDEDLDLLRMRVERMQHPSAHGMDLSIRTSRVVGNVRVTGECADSVEASARFLIVESAQDRQRIFAGRYHYTLKRGQAWRIQRKRVDLVNSDSPFASIQVLL